MERFIWFVHFLDRSQCIRQRQRENWMTELNKMNGRTRNIILWLCSTLEHIFNFDNPFIVDWIQHTNTASSGYHPECALHSYALPTMNGVEPRIEWNTQKRKKIHCVLFVRNHKAHIISIGSVMLNPYLTFHTRFFNSNEQIENWKRSRRFVIYILNSIT